MGWRQVEPRRKTCETSAILLHIGDGHSRNELCTLTAEEVRVGNHKILDAALFRQRSEILRHGRLPGGFEIFRFFGFLKDRCEVLSHEHFPSFFGEFLTSYSKKNRRLKTAVSWNPCCSCQRHPCHCRRFKCQGDKIFRLEIVDTVMSTRSCDRLNLEVHDLQVVCKAPTALDRIEA